MRALTLAVVVAVASATGMAAVGPEQTLTPSLTNQFLRSAAAFDAPQPPARRRSGRK